LSEFPTVEVAGLPVWRISVEELCDQIERWSDSREGHWIATLNLDYYVRCKRDQGFWKILSKADVFTADGMPILRACQKRDPRFEGLDRTTGADLTPRLIRRLDPTKVAIVGGVDPAAALKILEKDPADYFVFDGKVVLEEKWAQELAEKISERSVVFVALGCPKQEQMIALLQPYLPNAVFIAVGGSFEMIAGITGRAPKWMQKAGMEWLYRLSIEPKRLWKRYLVEGVPGVFALRRETSSYLKESGRLANGG